MTRERAKELLPAIKHWSEGNALWYYRKSVQNWYSYTTEKLSFEDILKTDYIIEDKHFEARKAYALSKPLEYRRFGTTEWKPVTNNPQWLSSYEYREAKPKWYELKENIGKAIMVREHDDQEWFVHSFKSYDPCSDYPFHIIPASSWKQARLLTNNEIAKETE